ncbi:taurine catabolism dioxygenase [Saitoella complicata NRRL Y-17804]|nr:taurine catabolism dioxygenase [Saitoella complicata NRRL Y-17804]ODQ54688.1 taurine catabolism dioxygenase [Saitoella complicata NRRL Y-17804]
MAPPSLDTAAPAYTFNDLKNKVQQSLDIDATPKATPYTYGGSLDSFNSFDITPIIGREFPDVDLRAVLNAPNREDLIHDLAVTISDRGVVFFRNQSLTTDEQKQLGLLLGELTGKPATSGLHIHPVINSGRDIGINEDSGEVTRKDDEISVISSDLNRKLYSDYGSQFADRLNNRVRDNFASTGWHSDITFEPVPANYTILKIHTLPPTGGDTLWASGYELYDRISPKLRQFLDTATGTFAQPNFNAAADKHAFKLYSAPRGAPENVGEDLTAIHPIVRTNPVTGWKSIFALGSHFSHINGLTKYESDWFKDYFHRLVTDNHDLQVRFKWNKNDVAIWDNRSVYHTATYDYGGKRQGNRVVALGERPYFDPASKSRREALGEVDAEA